jgi:hypothetical protein
LGKQAVKTLNDPFGSAELREAIVGERYVHAGLVIFLELRREQEQVGALGEHLDVEPE